MGIDEYAQVFNYRFNEEIIKENGLEWNVRVLDGVITYELLKKWDEYVRLN